MHLLRIPRLHPGEVRWEEEDGSRVETALQPGSGPAACLDSCPVVVLVLVAPGVEAQMERQVVARPRLPSLCRHPHLLPRLMEAGVPGSCLIAAASGLCACFCCPFRCRGLGLNDQAIPSEEVSRLGLAPADAPPPSSSLLHPLPWLTSQTLGLSLLRPSRVYPPAFLAG